MMVFFISAWGSRNRTEGSERSDSEVKGAHHGAFMRRMGITIRPGPANFRYCAYKVCTIKKIERNTYKKHHQMMVFFISAWGSRNRTASKNRPVWGDSSLFIVLHILEYVSYTTTDDI